MLTALPHFFFLMIRLPPTSPLFPYTTLFRSGRADVPPRPPRPDAGRPRLRAERRLPATARGRVAPAGTPRGTPAARSEEHTSELQSRFDLVCRLLLEKKKTKKKTPQLNITNT